ncbi:MAG: 3-oxoacyl-ACP reductase family protein [Bryobacteraceae bacterium]
MFRLDGKVALVTGSSRGIGAAIARTFAQAGADIIIDHLAQPAEAEQVRQEIKSLGRCCLVVEADVRDEQQVASLFTAIDDHFGRLDILVNNAGIVFSEDIFSTTLTNWTETLATHLTGTFLCSREGMKRMRNERGGRIIQISSVVAHQGALRGFVHYAAAKSGMLGFTRTLARTAAEYGVTVNAIAPGVIATDMLFDCHHEEGVRRMEAMIPLGLGKVEDVAAAALYLASDEARWVTGTVLDVNGGLYFH